MGRVSSTKLFQIGCLVASLFSFSQAWGQDIQQFQNATAHITAKLYQSFSANNQENIFISPLSIAVSLAMLTEGSVGRTKEALERIGLNSSSREQFKTVLNSLKKVKLANIIWLPSGVRMQETFAQKVRESYNVHTCDAAFDRVDTVEAAINQKIRNLTQGGIKDALPSGSISADTQMILANVVYFKGRWVYRFKKPATTEANFTNGKGQVIKVKMMNSNVSINAGHSSVLNSKVAVLPYGPHEKFSMVIIVPDSEGGYVDVERTLFRDPHLLRKTIQQLGVIDIQLSLPRFDIEQGVDLKPAFQNMGLGGLFSDQSDLTEIIENQTAILSSALHKSRITVDENGTEAAGASVFQITYLSANYDETREVIANRTFVFAVWDNENQFPLFVGRMADPSVKAGTSNPSRKVGRSTKNSNETMSEGQGATWNRPRRMRVKQRAKRQEEELIVQSCPHPIQPDLTRP